MKKTESVFGYPEVPTTIADIEDHNSAKDLKLRIINAVSGISIMCVVIKETGDSFLVALPSKLMQLQTTGLRKVEPYMNIRFFRIFKSSIVSLVPCFDEFEAYYIKYLLEVGIEIFPEMIKPLKKKLESRLEQIKKLFEDDTKELPTQIQQLEETSLDEIEDILASRSPSKMKH